MQAMELTMGLEKKQMSFYKQHAIIDRKHGKDIQEIVVEVCKTEEKWIEIMEVTKTSLWLMYGVLKGVIDEYLLLKDNKSVNYAILNQIPH
jgi:pyrroloquinoline quinone (PQQ) biosynthesis protein C